MVTLTLSPALDDSFTVDRLLPASKMRCSPARTDPGGGGINVARILHSLGEEAIAVFPLAGYLGQSLQHLLDLEGVATAPVPVTGETRQSHHVVDRETGLEYRFVLPGPNLPSQDQARCLEAVGRLAADARYVVLSGSLPEGVPTSFVREVQEVAAYAGARLVVDTSGKALEAVSGAYLIKPSLRELEALVGAPLPQLEDQVAGARDFLKRTDSSVMVISRGHRGVVVVTADQAEAIPAPDTDVVNTVGAGDALVAGITAGLCRDWELGRAVRFGVACSVAMTGTMGTNLFTAHALSAFTDELE